MRFLACIGWILVWVGSLSAWEHYTELVVDWKVMGIAIIAGILGGILGYVNSAIEGRDHGKER